MSAKSVIKRWLHNIGYDFRKYRPADAMETLLPHVLHRLDVNVVLDLGANLGSFARNLRAQGYRGKIVSIEPLADCHAQLVNAAVADKEWMIAERMAIGAEHGEVDIHRSLNVVSSSILDILPTHLRAASDSRYIGCERVPLRRLDEVVAEMLPSCKGPLALKMDVQGYEDRVLSGAERLLARLAVVQTELSLVPLYAAQSTYEALLARFLELGYQLYAVMGGFSDRRTGQMLQCEALFVRHDLVPRLTAG